MREQPDPKPTLVGQRHRQRERFLKSGFAGFADSEIVELLLTLAIPRCDVKPAAKALLARFGSVRGVLETKGRVWAGTEAKDKAMADWCERVTHQTGRPWRFARVNQVDFDRLRPKKLSEIVEGP